MKYKLGRGGMSYQYGVVAKNGRLVVGPVSCKDQLMSRLARQIFKKTTNSPPRIVYWVPLTVLDRSAQKFQRMINRIEKRLGIKGTTKCYVSETGRTGKTGAFVVHPSRWWGGHPLRMSALVIILSVTRYMKMREPDEKFFARVIKERKSKEAAYLRQALLKGTLEGFMKRTLPETNGKSKKGWRGYRYGYGFGSYTPKVTQDVDSAIKRVFSKD